MARKKEYDRNDVLEKSMKLFWKKGYEAASIQDLVDATGLNRFGLYHEFGSKEGLFCEALDRYRKKVAGEVIGVLSGEPGGLGSIRNFFGTMVNAFSQVRGMKGCLMANTAVDIHARDKGARSRVKKHLRKLEDSFYACLSEATSRGETGMEENLRANAQYLVSVTLGLSVFSRVKSNREQLENMVKIALGRYSN